MLVGLLTLAMMAIMVYSLSHKLTDWGLWRVQLAAYGSWVDHQLMAAFVVGIELLALVGMVSSYHQQALWLVAALLLIYGGVMAWQLAHHQIVDCGCGGGDLKISWWLVGRNLVLVMLALIASYLPSSPQAIWWQGLAGTEWVVMLAGLIVLSLLYAMFHQLLRIADRQKLLKVN